MPATAKAKSKTPTTTTPAQTEQASTEKARGGFMRARKFEGFKRVKNILVPACERERDRKDGIDSSIVMRIDGPMIVGTDGKVIGFGDGGLKQHRAALKFEKAERSRSTFSDPERDKAIDIDIAEIDGKVKDAHAERAENRQGVSDLRKNIERGPLFIRDWGDVRVRPVTIPAGVGDGRVFDEINAAQAKCAADIEQTELAPRTLAENIERLDVALSEIFKVGGRTINLDKITDPDAGLPKISFNNERVRDHVTGAVHEHPTAAQLAALLSEEVFKEICIRKLESLAEREGKGISDADRKAKLAALADKRFDLHLKLVGEWEACRERRIPVILPGDLSLFAFCGLKPRRARDYFAPVERDPSRLMRHD